MILTIDQKLLDQIAVRLKDLRKEAKLSQVDLARILNVDMAVISRMENGTKPHFKPMYFIALAKLYHCSCDYILCLSNTRGRLVAGKPRHKARYGR